MLCPHCHAPLDGEYDAGTRTLHAPWSCRDRLRERVAELEQAVRNALVELDLPFRRALALADVAEGREKEPAEEACLDLLLETIDAMRRALRPALAKGQETSR